ncbi:MAG: hypothetical protein PHN84_08820 [Desulfuromonadaceae bacterium]|nr:hypothetical protein [Desulfuromonadaceae bacterium]MDD2854739.1 hypothetical protein [Desulfuromonadaceae bacterium]
MKRALIYGVIAALVTLSTVKAEATDISFINGITKDAFKNLSKEAGAAFGYRNMAPAEPLGITGFDIGAEVSGISIDRNSSQWSSAFRSDAPSYLVIPKLRARKGLPLGIDIGASYSSVPNSNIKLIGAEISNAILEGSLATPAVGVRATYTRLTGVSDLALQTYGADASISKGFLFITPYFGAGMMHISSEAKGTLKSASLREYGINLGKEGITVPRYFVGLTISPLPLISITAEAEYAVRPIYSFKAAVSF